VIIILETFAGSLEMGVVAMMGSRVEKTWDWAAQNPVSYGSDRYIRGHRDPQWSLCRKAVIVTLETFAGSLEMAVVAMMGSRVEKMWDWAAQNIPLRWLVIRCHSIYRVEVTTLLDR
jgi:hypothetical protein